MTLSSLRKEVRKLANPTQAKNLQRFFKTGKGEYGEGDIFLGLTVPTSRSIAKKYSSLLVNDILVLLKSRFHEERLIALLMLFFRFQSGNDTEKKNVYNLYLKSTKYINNWDLVDLTAHKIVGAYLYDKNRDILYTLARSRSLWEQRISMIATFWFINREDFTDSLKLANELLYHEHDLIHKAVGWMLREVGKRDRNVLERFLDARYKKMPRTMLRYAIERFPEKLRQSYLKGSR